MINQDSLASDPKAAAQLTLRLRDANSMQAGRFSTTVVQCSIDSSAITFRLNGKLIGQSKYKAFLRSAFGGFEQPCFFIQQSKATALAGAAPSVLWTYLQETTGERLVRSMESQWLTLRPKLTTKYLNVVERISELNDSRSQGQSYLRVVDQLLQLRAEVTRVDQQHAVVLQSILQQECRAARLELQTLQEKLDAASDGQRACQDELDTATAAVQDGSRRKQEQAQQTQVVAAEMLAVQERVSTCETMIVSLRTTAAAVRRTRQERATMLRQLSSTQGEKKAELAKLGAKIAFLTGQLEAPTAVHDDAAAVAQKLRLQIAQLQNANAAAQRQLAEASDEEAAAQAAVDKYRSSLDALAADIQARAT